MKRFILFGVNRNCFSGNLTSNVQYGVMVTWQLIGSNPVLSAQF